MSLKKPYIFFFNDPTVDSYFKQITEVVAFDKSINLILSHSNYLKSIGGTERIIASQVEDFKKNNISLIQIYPVDAKQGSKMFGLNINGQELLTVDVHFLISLLRKFKFYNIFIHHTFKSANESLLLAIISLKKTGISRYYLHDFYSICPMINLWCHTYATNDQQEQTGLCSKGGNSCDTIYGHGTIKVWRKSYTQILNSCDQIVSPSDFVAKKVMSKLKLNKEIKIISPVIPYLVSTCNNNIKKNKLQNLKPNLCYLGAGAELKGFNSWLEIINDKQIGSKFSFIHLGADVPYNDLVRVIPYNYSRDGVNKVIDLLIQEEVSHVLILSLIPESFSFTMNEAISAGAVVLTTAVTGNVESFIRKNEHYGIVFDSFSHLFEYLKNEPVEKLKLFSKEDKIYNLKHNSLF